MPRGSLKRKASPHGGRPPGLPLLNVALHWPPRSVAIAEEGFVGTADESQQAENFTYVKTFRLTRIPFVFSQMAEIRRFFWRVPRESREILGFCFRAGSDRRRHEKARRKPGGPTRLKAL